MNNLVKTISLSKEDSIQFINSLLKPSFKDAILHNNHIDNINKNIIIHYNDEGFEADINNLDLSFIDNQ